jgi:dTDP-glucose 4,6-dehydratase
MDVILITGGAGFIGLNFVKQMLEEDIQIINLDLLTYASNIDQLKHLDSFKNYIFVKGDIRNPSLLQQIFISHDIRGVIHFAAESHVDNSISSPSTFIETNINGTFQLLEVARHHWMDAPFQPKSGYEDCRFLHVSTDEVYGSLGSNGLFTEESPYAPNSPYSASKASSDMIVRSYYHTYGMNTVITNCSNNFGPYQHDEKLIPTVIRSALNHKTIPIYGDGQNVRDWLFVEDHCRALKMIFNKAEAGAHYNVGGNNEQNNLDIVEAICKILDQLIPSSRLSSYQELITFVKDRPGHDRRYAVDATKLKRDFGWEPFTNFEKNLIDTVRWYIHIYGYSELR